MVSSWKLRFPARLSSKARQIPGVTAVRPRRGRAGRPEDRWYNPNVWLIRVILRGADPALRQDGLGKKFLSPGWIANHLLKNRRQGVLCAKQPLFRRV